MNETLQRLRTDLQYFTDLAYLAKSGPVTLTQQSLAAIIANLKATYQEVEAAGFASDVRAEAVAARMASHTSETQEKFQAAVAEAMTKHQAITEAAAASLLDRLAGNPVLSTRLKELVSGPLPLSSLAPSAGVMP